MAVKENILNVIARLGGKNSCLVIIDQLDSICESPLGKVIVEFAIDCKSLKNVTVIVISRHSEIEGRLLRPLFEADFEEIQCKELDDIVVRTTLVEMGMDNPSPRIIQLGKNILMLDLICSIITEQGEQVVEQLDHYLSIWDNYIELFLDRERESTGNSQNDILHELVILASDGLQSEDRGFLLHDPPTILQNRFISQGLITRLNESGRRYVFKIDKLQDHIYSRDATRRGLRKGQVEQEICPFHLRNIFLRMIDFYQRDDSPMYATFVEEVLSG